LQLSLPFDHWGTTSLSVARDSHNRCSERVSYRRAVPTDGGLGWNFSYASGQANLTWRTHLLEAQTSLYSNSNDYIHQGGSR